MKNKIFVFFIVLLLLVTLKIQAQVTTDPLFPTTDEPVKITIDVKQATDGRAQGLLGLTSGVFLWSGAGSSTNNAFEFQPSGQTNFNQPFESGTMTFEGDDVWSITITPRSYFNIPAGTDAVVLGVLLKNGAGTAQTEDFFVPIYDGGFSLVLTQPSLNEILVNSGEDIEIEASTSLPADFQLFIDDVLVGDASANEATSFNYTLTAATSGRREVKITADNGEEVLETKFFYIVKQTPNIANLPVGLRDGINYINATTVTVSLLAPLKSFVYIVGDFNNWELRPEYLANKSSNGERYWLTLNGLTPGEEYGFQYVVYDAENNPIRVADPYSELILDEFNDRFITEAIYPGLKPYPEGKTTGAVTVIQTNQTPYNWQVNDFQRPAKDNLVIYELLVRDFDVNGSYQDVIDRLDYLQNMGINAIELMPIMEFSGNDSWGYNPIFFTAVDKAYGTRNKLKELIDKCHERGMAVILDMVLNHADREFPYVKMYFDGNNPTPNNPWFNVQATHPFSVFYDFNHESQYTKDLIDKINLHWLEEYRFDGYRFDLSKGFTQNNTGDNVGAWSARDNSRIALIKRMADVIWADDPTAYIILEHFADNSEEKELAEYRAGEAGKGMILWGNMHGSFKENVLGFSNNSNITGTYARSLSNGGGRGWTTNGLVGYMESHDEERQMVDALANGASASGYNVRNLATALDRIKTANAFLFAIPGPKMYWQFGEVGYDVSINENGRTGRKPIRWEYFDEPNRNRLYRTFAELIKLKTTYPIFQTADISILGGSSLQKQITLTRQPFTSTPANANEMSVHILGNFGVTAQTVNANFQHTGTWYEYFSGSEDAPVEVSNANMSIALQPGEFRLYTNYPLPSPELELHNYTRPKTATNVEAQAISDIEINLSWEDNANLEGGVKILRSLSSGNSFAEIASLPANTTTYTDRQGLLAETTYFYKIVPFNATGENASQEVSVTTLAPVATPPAAPSNLTATPVGNSVRLNWTDNANNELSYVIERKQGTGSFTQIAAIDANSITYQNANVTFDTPYTYRVAAAIGSVKAYSNEINITVLASENNALANAIEISPNPAGERVRLRLLSASTYQNVQFEWLNAQGQLVKQSPRQENPQVGEYEWNISQLSTGVYFLKINTEQGFAVKRIVKE